MKDDSFRDLLNLYLDGELSAAEESRLAEYL
ncbi:MAG: zf-HC2 domain-containing protein, partial [Opitutales bacterium]